MATAFLQRLPRKIISVPPAFLHLSYIFSFVHHEFGFLTQLLALRIFGAEKTVDCTDCLARIFQAAFMPHR
jgi:hypothetical protein